MGGKLYDRMAVIGCGLIGSSVVRAARERGVVGEIVVFDASDEVRARVAELGIADRVETDAAERLIEAAQVAHRAERKHHPRPPEQGQLRLRGRSCEGNGTEGDQPGPGESPAGQYVGCHAPVMCEGA